MNTTSFHDLNDEQLLEAANLKSNRIRGLSSDLIIREQLVDELKKRNIPYDYDKILKGKLISFADIK